MEADKLHAVSLRIDWKTLAFILDDKPDLLHLLMDEISLRRLYSQIGRTIIELDAKKQREELMKRN